MMLYIDYLFEFMIQAFRGLDLEESTKAYWISILKRLLGIVVITGILFGLVAILLLVLDGLNDGSSIAILFNYFIALYIVASLPTTLDTLRSLKHIEDQKHKHMSLIYIVCIMVFGVLLHFGGSETLFGLLDV